MVRVRIWPRTPQDAEADNVESRFPPGSRSGEGSASLHVFLEAARKSRVQVGPVPPERQGRARRNGK